MSKNLIKLSDAISIHVHVNKNTKYMINQKILDFSTKKPFIINTSRGEIVNEADIYKSLKKKIISGYATDVLEYEFEDIRMSPIYKASKENLNVIITPHIGGMTFEGSQRAWSLAIKKMVKIN